MTLHLQRRCVACGKREHKSSLFRLVFKESRVVWDRQQRIRGRGAYCHQKNECVIRLAGKGLLGKALRCGSGDFKPEYRAALIKELLDFIG